MENFTDEETERIIARAARISRSNSVSRVELLRIADQMGIDPKAVAQAIEDEKREYEKQEKQKAKRKKYLAGFYSHLATYSIIIGFLFTIDVLSGSGWWFFWPMLGWGIGIAFHALPLIMNQINPDTGYPDK